MILYRKRPILVEATQWFKNGDHPKDFESTYHLPSRDAIIGEGQVVRYFRHPDVLGNQLCRHCGIGMDAHGWIDDVQGGHTVCPGDWIITEQDGLRYYPCKLDAFEATYELVEEPG